MLQPTETDPPPDSLQPGVPHSSQVHGQGGRRVSEREGTLWRWISVKELVFIFLACSVGAALFRSRDSLNFDLAWQEALDTKLYRNLKFPFDEEKLPPPLVTDIDTDGVADILLLTYDYKLKLHSFPDVKNPLKPQTHQHSVTEKATVNIPALSGGKPPVAMATGFLRQYQSMIQVRKQVVVVLTSNWTVLCFDHELKLLWKSQPIKHKENNIIIREAAILVSPTSIQKGDTGSVIVGGRTFSTQKPEPSYKRMRRGEKPEDADQLLESLGHYTTFALEGRSGELRWQHTPADFQVHPAYPPDISSFYHLKLMVHKQLSHEGEVSWHQYSSAVRSALPHTWLHARDTHFALAHFKKDQRRRGEPDMTEHISHVGDLAMGHIAGLAFGGLQPHSPSEHVQDPNVLIIHSVKGIDVLHLYQGRPLCSLPLSPYHATHADINADGNIDHVHAVVNPGEAGFSQSQSDSDCYGQALSMTIGSRLFKHSICKATHWTETFIATDKWLPGLNIVGRKPVNHAITEPLAPVLIESSYHSAPLKLHLVDVGGLFSFSKRLSKPLPSPSRHQGPMYDSVFVLSSGRITSIGPQGEFNWQVDTAADWDTASEVIYNPEHPSWKQQPEHIMFVHGGFMPSAVAYSIQAYGKKDHVLVVGWQWLTVVSGEDGVVVARIKLSCQPVSSPVIVDFTSDGWNDIIITCAEAYMGYSLQRQSGFWHSTVLSLFIGMVFVVIAIYTRQRTVGLLPVIKTAQD